MNGTHHANAKNPSNQYPSRRDPQPQAQERGGNHFFEKELTKCTQELAAFQERLDQLEQKLEAARDRGARTDKLQQTIKKYQNKKDVYSLKQQMIRDLQVNLKDKVHQFIKDSKLVLKKYDDDIQDFSPDHSDKEEETPDIVQNPNVKYAQLDSKQNSDDEIAQDLDVSQDSVEVHKKEAKNDSDEYTPGSRKPVEKEVDPMEQIENFNNLQR